MPSDFSSVLCTLPARPRSGARRARSTRAGATRTSTPGAGGVNFAGVTRSLLSRESLESRRLARAVPGRARRGTRPRTTSTSSRSACRGASGSRSGRSIRVDVTGVRSPLKSLDFVTLRVKDAVCDRFRDDAGKRPDVDTREPDVRISAFLTEIEATFYLDTSGEPLFKRGLRADAGDAPLQGEPRRRDRRCSAAGAGDEPFLDPMCGSGTIVHRSGADRARDRARQPPSVRLREARRVRCGTLGRACATRRARASGPRTAVAIYGADINPREVRARAAIAKRRALENVVQLKQCEHRRAAAARRRTGSWSRIRPTACGSASAKCSTRSIRKLGDALKARFAGWRCYFLTADLTPREGDRAEGVEAHAALQRPARMPAVRVQDGRRVRIARLA